MSSPDRIPPGETKPERERRVFSFFAADVLVSHGIIVRPETIENREPPEPDIFCQIVGQGAVAFELVEVLDEDSRRVMATMMSARRALLGHLSILSVSDLGQIQSKFAMKQIKVGFRRDKPLRDLQAIIPSLYEWLIHSVADDVYGDAVPLPVELQADVAHVSILFPGPPFIDIAFGLTIADETVSAITRKLALKRYTTIAPVELLVYAHDQPLIHYETWQSAIVAAVVPLVEDSIVRGHIRRVWIYDISRRKTDQAVKFVYPTPCQYCNGSSGDASDLGV